MKCPQIEELIESYNDGELDPLRVSEFEAHLASCANCSRILESVNREDRLYEAYGQNLCDSLEITPSMWSGIRRGIEAETKPGGPIHMGIVDGFGGSLSRMIPSFVMKHQRALASVLIIFAILGTLLIVRYHQDNIVALNKGASRQAPAEKIRDLESALLSIRNAEQQYIEAIRMLSDIVDEKKDSLDPALAAELEKNLKAIDKAIEASRQAYHAQPANPELAQHMLKAYQKKVELLEELALDFT